MTALDQARLDWVTKNLEVTHEIYQMAASGDKTALSLRKSIWKKGHLTERQLAFAKRHVRDGCSPT